MKAEEQKSRKFKIGLEHGGYASQVALVVKNVPAMQETSETQVQSLSQEDSPGGEHGNPLQYSCLENSMDREAWQATVHGIAKSPT